MKTTENRVHQETWGLLPWLANGRADAAQRDRAEAHLAECADCRAELAREQRLSAAKATPKHPDHVATLDQRSYEMLPNKACAAGNKYAHTHLTHQTI